MITKNARRVGLHEPDSTALRRPRQQPGHSQHSHQGIIQQCRHIRRQGSQEPVIEGPNPSPKST